MAKPKRPAAKASKSGTVAARPRRTLSREAWIAAARKVLEKRGIAEVKIDRLARQLKVTRGSVYFHFSSLQDLHDGLLQEWQRAFRQVAWAGSFEGYSSLGLGVRARLPFRVFALDGPDAGSRLVVDVAHFW